MQKKATGLNRREKEKKASYGEPDRELTAASQETRCFSTNPKAQWTGNLMK